MKKIMVVGLFFLVGCASTEFQTFEARNNVHQGQGGSRITVDGIDFWANGDPPRKYTILGFIDDNRHGGIIPMAQLRGDIARKAKEAGADAVIQVTSQAQLAGFYNTGTATAQTSGSTTTAYGSGVSMPIMRNISKFAVIKYLD